MKRMRIYLYAALSAFLVLFIVGTFCDYQISKNLFSDNNTFGLIVSVIGTTPGYGMFAIIGGGFLAFGLRKNDYNKWLRVLFFAFSAICLGASTYFAGREFFGPNGFYWVTQQFWGYFIALPCMVACTYLGYRLMRNCQNKNLWILLLILTAAFAIALTGGVTLLKVIFNRPRYRFCVHNDVRFYPWYEICKLGLRGEEFKSFPSGHAAAVMGLPLMVLFLPLVDEKYTKLRLPIFVGGLVFALLVMFSRMLVGAHYLSDVSMGAILVIIMMIIGLEIARVFKKFNL